MPLVPHLLGHNGGMATDASLAEELRTLISGEVDDSTRVRALYSTDASNYRVIPSIVCFPHDSRDVALILGAARQAGVPVTSRGGGTSVAGNSIGEGVVIDFSRYMNQILDIDPVARTARVQPGVIMSDLQKAAAQHGLRFGPDPSTQNRATFGGMIGNNACGPHAVAYGRTADNVVDLECIDGQGRAFRASDGIDAVPGLKNLVSAHLSQIRTELGRFGRQVSGYSLEHLLPENGENLARFLVGTEGTLVTITEATIKLVPIAEAPTLIVLGYPDMATAARDVPAILPFKPLAVEGIDARLVDVVRRAKGSVPPLPDGGGWLFIEVGASEGEDVSVVAERVAGICAAVRTDAVVVKEAGPQASQLWRIRADGAGLGGRTPEGRAAWPGWEDSAVPPECLGDYLTELQAVMTGLGLDGLMYGHFGDGCVHVRIDFPFDQPDGASVFRQFMEAATDVAVSYGGSLSGEHGDGRARSSFLNKMYSAEVLELFGKVKWLFDPQNTLNPGVLVEPESFDSNLRRIAARPIAAAGGFTFHEDNGDFTTAVHRCTGVGNCRADRRTTGHFMCPSYLATGEERDVTRGRARVLQELANGEFVKGFADRAVLDVLDLCLSCKACSSDCPTGIDMAKYRSETLFRAYKGKIRPRTHYTLGQLPKLAGLVTAVPAVARIANVLMGRGTIRKLTFAVAGIDVRRRMVSFATERFSKAATKLGVNATKVPDTHDKKYVLLWADSFSEHLDTRGAQAMVAVLQSAGYTVIIPDDPACCGLTYISTGQLDKAKRELTTLLTTLAPYAASGIPIVGVEPSCTAVLRDDLRDLLPDDARTAVVSGMTYTLAELLSAPAPVGPENFAMPDLTGMEIIAQPHCHHYSVMGWQADAALLEASGATVRTLAGCCGLAGNFGMEKGHYSISVAVAQNSLLPALESAGKDAVFLADGFSCRTQAAQLVGDSGVHFAELIRDAHAVRRKGETA